MSDNIFVIARVDAILTVGGSARPKRGEGAGEEELKIETSWHKTPELNDLIS